MLAFGRKPIPQRSELNLGILRALNDASHGADLNASITGGAFLLIDHKLIRLLDYAVFGAGGQA